MEIKTAKQIRYEKFKNFFKSKLSMFLTLALFIPWPILIVYAVIMANWNNEHDTPNSDV